MFIFSSSALSQTTLVTFADLLWNFLYNLLAFFMGNNFTILLLLFLTNLLCYISADFFLHIFAVFDRNISADLFLNKLFLKPGLRATIFHRFRDTRSLNRLRQTVSELHLTNI